MEKRQETSKRIMLVGEFAEFILAQYEIRLQKFKREFRQWSQQENIKKRR